MNPLILASASPRRTELLTIAGIPHTIMPADIEETTIPDESATEMVTRLSLLKADYVATQHPSSWVIGADTTVVHNDAILGKPTTKIHAMNMLTSLQGDAHTVSSGFSIVHKEKDISYSEISETMVIMRPLSNIEIIDYVDTGEPMDKAGAYGIQGKARVFIEAITGSYDNVVGLDICKLVVALKRLGAL